MFIRPETPADQDQVAEVVRRAFGREAEATLVAALRREPDYLAELSLVAVWEDGPPPNARAARTSTNNPASTALVVGHILFSPITIGDTPAPRAAGQQG
jgi:predicted N-acetyltransferase YhbS